MFTGTMAMHDLEIQDEPSEMIPSNSIFNFLTCLESYTHDLLDKIYADYVKELQMNRVVTLIYRILAPV